MVTRVKSQRDVADIDWNDVCERSELIRKIGLVRFEAAWNKKFPKKPDIVGGHKIVQDSEGYWGVGNYGPSYLKRWAAEWWALAFPVGSIVAKEAMASIQSPRTPEVKTTRKAITRKGDLF